MESSGSTDKTVIYFVRHGQTDYNVEKRIQGALDVPLNSEGISQAKNLRNFFSGKKLFAVFCSPLLRTQQTAKLITDQDLILINDLKERNFGELEGFTRTEYLKKVPDLELQWKKEGIDWLPPGGETVRDFQKRCIAAYKNILKESKGRTVLIVAHGGVIKSIVHYIHGGKPEDYFHQSNIENAEVVTLSINNNSTSIERTKG